MFTEDTTASDEDRMWETVYIKRDEVVSWNVVKEKSSGTCTTVCIHSGLLVLGFGGLELMCAL